MLAIVGFVTMVLLVADTIIWLRLLHMEQQILGTRTTFMDPVYLLSAAILTWLHWDPPARWYALAGLVVAFSLALLLGSHIRPRLWRKQARRAARRRVAPGGWFPDPGDPGALRYWDGSQWTGNTHPVAGRPDHPREGGDADGGFP